LDRQLEKVKSSARTSRQRTPMEGKKAGTLGRLTESMVRDASHGAEEPAWLGAKKVELIKRFRKIGLPSPMAESWRGTAMRELGILDLPFPRPGRKKNPSMQLKGGGESKAQAKKAPLFLTLDQAARSHPDLVQPHLFGAYELENTPSLAALNGACITDGAFLHVPPNIETSDAFNYLYRPDPMEKVSFSRNVVVLEEGSRCAFVEDYQSFADSRLDFSNGVTEVFVGPGAHLDILTILRWDDRVRSCHRAVAHVAEGGSISWYLGTAGGDLVRMDMEISLLGRGAESLIQGVGMGSGTRHMDHKTVQHHASEDTRSRIRFGTLLSGESTSIYRGLIRMEQYAGQCDAYQKNDNLVLEKGPRAQAIPMLEILADDVKCSHGSTVGRVRDEDLFYLASRGISRDQGLRLIAEGFLRRGLLDDKGASPLVEHLHRILSARLSAPGD
jgi:Fe-S cluster assembly protein SufD